MRKDKEDPLVGEIRDELMPGRFVKRLAVAGDVAQGNSRILGRYRRLRCSM